MAVTRYRKADQLLEPIICINIEKDLEAACMHVIFLINLVNIVLLLVLFHVDIGFVRKKFQTTTIVLIFHTLRDLSVFNLMTSSSVYAIGTRSSVIVILLPDFLPYLSLPYLLPL